jgi:hypothetical protein
MTMDELSRNRARRVGPEPEHDEIIGRALSFPGPAVFDRHDVDDVPLTALSGHRRQPLVAAGPRVPRPAATTLGGDATTRHNWVPIGPRNISGRIKALACADPAAATTWYAGSAGGGVWKTTNGGRRWAPLWHGAQGCLEVAALAVAPNNTHRVYAATGEAVPASHIAVRSFGVFVSTDDGVTWDNHGAGGAPNPVAPRGFEAIAVDPANELHCWAVSPDGAFRTTDGGTVWVPLDPGVHYTDVAFAGGRLFLARGTSTAGEGAVVRLGTPATATTADLRNAANASVCVPALAAHFPWPHSAALAVAPSNQAIIYARWVGENDKTIGIFRTTNANAGNAAAIVWRRLAGAAAMAEEDQGSYDLAIAVDPTDPSNVVTAQQLYVFRSTNADVANPATVTWQRIMSWELRNEGLDGHQADHHHLVFAGNPAELWVASDGGIARSADWRTGGVPTHGQRFRPDPVRPAPPGAVRWEKRDHGIGGAQFYDLAQHPLVPAVVAGGLQDNGTVLRPGGLTWQRVFVADGGHVVFDPDDPYRFDISYFAGLVALQFPALLDRLFADGSRDEDSITFRFLGADDIDESPFVPETERHPRRTGRLLHSRVGRLWGASPATGETLTAEALGRSFELRFTAPPPPPPPPPPAPPTTVTVADTPGAWRLGLVPGAITRPDRSRVVLFSRYPAPYVLTEGDTLTLTVNGTAFTTTFAAAAGINPAAVTAADVVNLVGAAVPAAILGSVEVHPYVWAAPSAVLLVAGDVGPVAPRQIQLDGNALDVQPDGLSRLGLNRGTYVGDAHGASVLLGFSGLDAPEQAINRDLRGNPVLSVAVNGRPAVNVNLGATFADAQHVSTTELAEALRVGLAGEPIEVRAGPLIQTVVLRADPGLRVVLTGTAATRMGINPRGAAAIALGVPTLVSRHGRTSIRNRCSVDLTPAPPAGAPLTLTIGDGAANTAALTFTAANVAALRSVTVEELHRLITAHLALHPAVQVRAELRAFPIPGEISEIRFSPADDDDVWVGLPDGSVFVSRDDGITWTDVTDPAMRTMDRQVEAIACHPTNANTVYVGLVGEAFVANDPGFLFRTTTGGAPWAQIGHNVVGGAATGIATGGLPLGINAIELDPANPDVVYAATDAGVFRSPDAGTTWAPFGEGLPNAPVVDLAVEPTDRLLRAALWTRGVHERRLDTAAPDDARLVIRAAELDDGHRPPRAAPSFLRAAPEPVLPDSPDIKHVRRRPVGADVEVDGVAFDLAVPHDDVVGGSDSEVVVQVANYGALAVPPGSPPPAADQARVIALWAPVDGGVPPLPADVWMRLTAGPLAGAVGAWTVIGDGQVPRPIGPGDAGIVSFAIAWPALAGVRRLGLLALTTATADPIPAGPLDVVALVERERRAAYREVPVRLDEDDRTLLLRSTGGMDIVVDQVAPPVGTGVADRLGFVAADIGGAGGRVRVAAPAGAATYNLAVGAPAPGAGIELRTAAPIAADLVMLPDPGEVADPTDVTRPELAEMITRRAGPAGLPIEALNPAVQVAIVSDRGVTFRVTGGAAAARLGMAVAAAADFILSNENVAWFNLTGAAALNLEFVLPGAANVPVAVDLAAERFPNPAVADPEIIAGIINEALLGAQLATVAESFAIGAVAVRGRGAATVALGGAAAAPIGFAPGVADVVVGIPPAAVNLTAGPVLHVEVTPRVIVRFDGDPADIPNLAAATPGDVRRAINVACEVASVPVRAEVPQIDLRVAASPGDTGSGHTVAGGAHLAELAVLAVGQVANADVFTVRAALGADRLEIGVNNQLALRVRNAGNVACATTRLRLLDVATGVTPLTTADIASVVVNVDAGAEHFETIAWDPLGAPRTATVLVVADDDRPGRSIAIPPFNTLEELIAFASATRAAALRTFEVVDNP